MAVKKVRTVQMYFYEGEGQFFKVWSGHDGGWHVDVVNQAGESTETVAYALASVHEAEEFMNRWDADEECKCRFQSALCGYCVKVFLEGVK